MLRKTKEGARILILYIIHIIYKIKPWALHHVAIYLSKLPKLHLSAETPGGVFKGALGRM
jgi:hypothetical protein